MTLTAILAGHAADIFAGHTVVLSDRALDDLAAHYNDLDGPESARWFRELVSAPNPDRVGILDAYVCYLRDRQPELLALLRAGLMMGLDADQLAKLQAYKAGLELPVGAEVEEIAVRAAHNGLHSVMLRVMRDVTRMEFWDRRAMVYCDALGHWTVDYLDSPGRPSDSECSTDWNQEAALKVARGFVYATRIADLDVTDSIIDDVRRAAHAAIVRGLKPAKGLTKPRAAVLLKVDGLRLEYVSNVLVYAAAFKRWGKVDHKMLLSLALAGYVRIYKVSGALPSAHSVNGASKECHYRLEVCKPSEGK